MEWGTPSIINQRLGDHFKEIKFERGTVYMPALSGEHIFLGAKVAFGPLTKLVEMLEQKDPEKLKSLHRDIVQVGEENLIGNRLPQHYLMTRAVRK